MKYLIYTQPHDAHAVVVKLALEKLGHEVQLWFVADQPRLLSHSVSLNLRRTFWESSDNALQHELSEFDAVWLRRIDKPNVPKDLTHPEDHTFVERENRLFFESMTMLLATNAWWINSPQAARRANSKLLQLHLAKKCGLQIPATLCSNSPIDIREFIKSYKQSGVIYKPLCPTIWTENNKVKALYTAIINENDLPDDETLKLTPGIYQPYIKKKYELRITCFGTHCVAVRLEGSAGMLHNIDWRATPEKNLVCKLEVLPQPVEFKIQSLMRQLGLMFGCVDMIVTPTDEYYFLEINEQGQFLWIEEMNPEIQLLDRFIKFLVHRSFYFNWNYNAADLYVKDYKEQTILEVEKNVKAC